MTAPLKNKAKRRWIWIVVFVLVSVFCVLFYPFYKRTIPGRLVRFFVLQQGMVQQDADDLADDVRHDLKLASIQEWSVKKLARYRAGQVATNGNAEYWSHGTVRLASSEIPRWLSGEWLGDRGIPEVSVKLNKAGNADCIAIGWYYNGLLVGPTNYIAGKEAWYFVEAKPGIYAYGNYK